MALIERVETCHSWDAADFQPLWIDGLRFGWVTHALAERLAAFDGVFRPAAEGGVALDPALCDIDRRSEAVDSVVDALVDEGIIRKRRQETYPVVKRWGDEPVLRIDRGAVTVFGMRSFGIHVNGFVRKPDGLHLWVGVRAPDKAVAPGKLDHLIAGGQPHGLSLFENLIKEGGEEAGLSREILAQSLPVGAISYRTVHEGDIRDDVLFCYDLELSEDIAPVNTDGEVTHFELWPVEAVLERLETTQDFKFNVALVVIDFLIRHGVIPAEHPDYVALNQGLHEDTDR